MALRGARGCGFSARPSGVPEEGVCAESGQDFGGSLLKGGQLSERDGFDIPH